MHKITERQRTVLKAIMDYTEKHKYPPTIRELADIVGLKSTSTMHGHLERLKVRGFITWEPTFPRTIKVVEDEGYAV